MTLYPNEEEDEITRLRRDEQEVNIAQRMQQLGFQPELTEDAGSDIRFVYKKPDCLPIYQLTAPNMATTTQRTANNLSGRKG